MRTRRWSLAFATVVILSACGLQVTSDGGLVTGVDPLSQKLLSEQGLRPSGPSSAAPLEVWESADRGVPWDLYLEASQRIGLDFQRQRGAPAELRTTPLEGPAGRNAYVLVLNGTVIGAWLGEPNSAPGVYSLDEPPRGP